MQIFQQYCTKTELIFCVVGCFTLRNPQQELNYIQTPQWNTCGWHELSWCSRNKDTDNNAYSQRASSRGHGHSQNNIRWMKRETNSKKPEWSNAGKRPYSNGIYYAVAN